MEDLVKREGLYYKKFSDVPFSGKVTGKEQGAFKNGERAGLWIVYYDEGQLSYKGAYKDGEKEGNWVVYFEDGKLWSKGAYKEGKREGDWAFFFVDGSKRFSKNDFYGDLIDEGSGTYKDGKKVSD